MVKISPDLLEIDTRDATWLTPRFGRVEKLRHVNLIKNNNVGNVYTDN
jgi:hypothetical protein